MLLRDAETGTGPQNSSSYILEINRSFIILDILETGSNLRRILLAHFDYLPLQSLETLGNSNSHMDQDLKQGKLILWLYLHGIYSDIFLGK